jgi:hypothetical protein
MADAGEEGIMTLERLSELMVEGFASLQRGLDGVNQRLDGVCTRLDRLDGLMA